MGLMDKISQDEMKMFDAWRHDYCLDNATQSGVPLTEILTVWESQNEKLAQLFDGNLMLAKDVTFLRGEHELQQDIDNAIHGWNSPASRFVRSWNEMFYARMRECGYDDDKYDMWYSIEDMMRISNLARNIYDGRTYILDTPDGDQLKIQHGCKISKVMGKIAKAFGLEGYEEFRIAHSQALNQKQLKGHLVLSIHPLDYITMSDNECGWGSCMSWRDYGEYRRGTVEMMNSPCVIIAYLTASDPMRIRNMEWNNKKWRELFVVDKDIIAGIKGYPYANENLENAVLFWLKELVEQHWQWSYEDKVSHLDMSDDRVGEVVGRENICVSFHTDAMYNDFYYNHQAILGSAIKDSRISVNYSGPSQCMCCGRVDTDFNDSCDLSCYDCDATVYCSNCGDRMNRDDVYDVDGYSLCYSCYYDLDLCGVCGERHVDIRPVGISHNGKFYNGEFIICSQCLDEEILGPYDAWHYNDDSTTWFRAPARYIDYNDMYAQTREKYIKRLFGMTIQEIDEELEDNNSAVGF